MVTIAIMKGIHKTGWPFFVVSMMPGIILGLWCQPAIERHVSTWDLWQRWAVASG